MSDGRLSRIVGRARGNHGLHQYTTKAHPGQRAYPDWYAWTHIRGYLCTLTGGCAWGPLHPHWSGEGRSCWKCRSTWSNPRETQGDRPWRALHPRLYWLDALVRRRGARRLERIAERARQTPGGG